MATLESRDENENEAMSCQVCSTQYEGLKVIISCGHSVCKDCFKKVGQEGVICPVCEMEFVLDAQKSESYRKERRLCEEERNSIFTIQKKCQEKIEKIEEILQEIDDCQHGKIARGSQLKQEIHEMSDGLVEIIRKQERELCEKIDEDVSKDVHKIVSDHRHGMESLLEKSKQFLKDTENVLNEDRAGSGIISNSVEITEAQLYPAGVELISSDSHTVKFETNRKLVEKLVKEGIGKIESNRNPVNAANPRRRLSHMLSIHFQTPEVLFTINALDLGVESFSPISLASDGKNTIAVADPENHSIYLLNATGKVEKRFTASGSAFGPATFSGICFTRGREILAVHGSTHIHFINPDNGRFRLSYKTSPSHGVKYCFVSCDEQGKVIVTCEPALKGFQPCVFVYSETPLGEPELKFGFSGENRLDFPFRALYHNNHYFVSDMEKGCIMVFNKDGGYERQFGNKERGEGELVLPIGFAIDSRSDCAYICDWGSNSLQVYKLSGEHVFTYTLDGRPTDIALLEDKTVVLCSKDDKWIKFMFIP